MSLADEILYERNGMWYFRAFDREFGPFKTKTTAIEGLKRIFNAGSEGGMCKNCGD